jgi:hypothetical protein
MVPSSPLDTLLQSAEGHTGSNPAAEPSVRVHVPFDNSRVVASLDRKRLGAKTDPKCLKSVRGVFDMTRRKALAFAADAVSYGN